jgi:hypothetical protein
LRKQRVHSGADGASGEENVVDENDALVLDIEADVGFLHERLGSKRGKVVAVEGDVQCSDGNRRALHALDDFREPLGDRDTAPADSHQAQPFDASIFLDNFMRQANQRALNFGGGHQLRFLAQGRLWGSVLRSHNRRHDTWWAPQSARKLGYAPDLCGML